MFRSFLFLFGLSFIRYGVYHVPTFWQINTLWFVSLNTEGLWLRSSSGSSLNYLIHESWFLFDENWLSHCCCRKGDHLLTKCHGMSRTAESGWALNSISGGRSNVQRPFAHPAELEFTPHCHAHPNIGDAGNMQNRSSHFGILELRIEMLLDVAWIFLDSLHKDLLEPRRCWS